MHTKTIKERVLGHSLMHTAFAGFFGGSNWHVTLAAALETAATECANPAVQSRITELQQLLAEEPPLQSTATVTTPLAKGLNGKAVIEALEQTFHAEDLPPEMLEPIEASYDDVGHAVRLKITMASNPSITENHAKLILESTIKCVQEALTLKT